MKEGKKEVYCPMCFQPMDLVDENKYRCLRQHGSDNKAVEVVIKCEN